MEYCGGNEFTLFKARLDGSSQSQNQFTNEEIQLINRALTAFRKKVKLSSGKEHPDYAATKQLINKFNSR